MGGDPFVLIEGMIIAGIAVGATKGYVYIRSEYPHAIASMTAAIEAARRKYLLGSRVAGSPYGFDIEVRAGAGAYVCGEETSLLESLEGRRGIVRARPPLPAHKGLFGRPTVINNVLSLASVPIVLAEGAPHYRDCPSCRRRSATSAWSAAIWRFSEAINSSTSAGRLIPPLIQILSPKSPTFLPSKANSTKLWHFGLTPPWELPRLKLPIWWPGSIA